MRITALHLPHGPLVGAAGEEHHGYEYHDEKRPRPTPAPAPDRRVTYFFTFAW